MTKQKNAIFMDHIGPLIDLIPDGTIMVVPADYGGSPAEAARALVRAGRRNLHIVGGPPSGYVADLLIGAGCVSGIEAPGVILGDFGLAQRFRHAVSAGEISMLDTTCPAFHTSILAAQKGLPFIPMRGLIGSDVLKFQKKWKVIDNPYSADASRDPIVLIPAFVPEVFLFHATYGDIYGNVWIGKNFEVKAIAQTSQTVIATFEELYNGDLLDDERLAPSTVSHIYMKGTAHVPGGAQPVFLPNRYPVDAEHLNLYAKLSRTKEGFQEYLERFVFESAVA